MASKSRRIPNIAGSANSFLNAVKVPDKAEGKQSNAIAAAGKKSKEQEAIVKGILATIH